jgi:hypothetical protein
MNGVVKSKGKFILLPDPTDKARKDSTKDRDSLTKELNETEIRSLLVKILMRLEKLEQR